MKNAQEINEEAKLALKAIRTNTSIGSDYEMYKIGTAIEVELKKQVQQKENGRAVNKRRRQLNERLTLLMSTFLKKFENRYMEAYTEWSMSPFIDKSIIYSALSSEKQFRVELQNTKYSELRVIFGISPNKRYSEDKESTLSNSSIARIYYQVIEARKKMETESLTRFVFMQEAAKGYATKFENLINKMVSYDFSTRNLRVEEIGVNGNELEFLITNDERTIHARAIFVNGAIKAPHYRFITTERKS